MANHHTRGRDHLIYKTDISRMYLNHVLIMGNMARDPELRALPSGQNVCNFTLATNRVYKDRNNAKKEEVEFHSIVVFGRTADSIAQYLKKGDSAFVEGRIQTRSWEKDGEKQYRTEIVAESVKFGPRKKGVEKDEVSTEDTPF